jgi:hypothetical protein
MPVSIVFPCAASLLSILAHFFWMDFAAIFAVFFGNLLILHSGVEHRKAVVFQYAAYGVPRNKLK